jgi:CBS domain-containing protein
MTERRVGSVIVKKNGKTFGIITERDLLRRYSRSTILERLASHPLISAEPSTTIEKVVDIVLKNKIRFL